MPDVETPTKAALVIVRLEDIARADVPDVVIVEARRQYVHLEPGAVLEFEIDVPSEERSERRRYSVSAHVSITGSATIKKGDFITMQSYPVSVTDEDTTEVVRLKRV